MTDPTYTSDPQPGDPASRADLGDLTMWKLSVSDMHNNVYLLREKTSGDMLLIDAADDADSIRALLHAAGPGRLTGILTTHKHWDHHRALPDLAPEAEATYAGELDADAMPVPISHRVTNGDSIQLGDQTISFHHVPGHTPGSIVASWSPRGGGMPHLWTGDTLFPGGVGATDRYPDQSFDTLLASVRTAIFDAFDDAAVHPGHGDDTTLAAERPHLHEWEQRGW